MAIGNSFATDRAANTFDNAESSTVARSPLTTDIPRKASSYAIATSGTFTDNGSSNFAGDLSNPFDDARLYAGSLTINGMPTFSGFGAAIAVGPGAVVPDAVRQRWTIENLSQAVAIDIPAYELPTLPGTDYVVDVRSLSLNNTADVVRVFGDSGLPSIVYFTGGSLALPDQVNLKNVTIVVENGDLNFNGDRHLLENVTIVVKDGSVNLGNVRAVNSSVYSAGGIRMNQEARFSGKNFLGTKNGDVIFNGATETIDPKNFVKVVAHGDIFLNAGADVRGEFWSSEDFFANGGSTIVGKIRATQSVTFNAPVQIISDGAEYQPLIGIIDTGFNGSNPDIDYSRIILGRDRIDGDDNPLLVSGDGNEHGTHILGLIGANQNNGIGIDGVNDQALIWLGRAVGVDKWSESLIEFVDTAKNSDQPHAVVNLSFDLVQLNADGSVTIRYELTPKERQALEYARQNGVLVVAASGNNAGVMSALGQASQEFDNIVTVGASNGLEKAAYSSYGNGLDILAPGGTKESPVISTVEDHLGSLTGSSASTALVTGAVSQVWSANPNLNYRQVIDILKNSATDLNLIGWDAETGSGLLNMEKAISLAKTTAPKIHLTENNLLPTTWGGDEEAISFEQSANFSGAISDKTAVTINEGLNIRSGPGISFAQVKDANGKKEKINPNNTSIEFDFEAQGELVVDPNGQGSSKTWYRLADGRGWVSALYISNIQQKNDLPLPKSSVPYPFYPTWSRNQTILGKPISDITQYSTDTNYMIFEGGSIVNSPLGIFPLWGNIRQEYLRIGGLASWLGVPKSGLIGEGNGVVKQYFANGYIIWNGRNTIAYGNKNISTGNSTSTRVASRNEPVSVTSPSTPLTPSPVSKMWPDAQPVIDFMASEVSNNSKSVPTQIMRFIIDNRWWMAELFDLAFFVGQPVKLGVRLTLGLLPYLIWGYLVRAGGDWDQKQKVKDRSELQNWVTDTTTGRSYEYESWSNMHYGFVGRYAGFSRFELLQAAGVAQLLTNGLSVLVGNALKAGGNLMTDPLNHQKIDAFIDEVRKISNVIYGSNPKAIPLDPSSFDDPKDQAAIKDGFRLYNRFSTSISKAEFISDLRSESSLHKAYGEPPSRV
jgi:hypothetical protein